MKKPDIRKPSTQTGPLAQANVGTFTFRDGVWYLNPTPRTVKK